jgi:hypothetical protein
MFSKGGATANFYAAILAEAFRRMGVPVPIAAVPWRRVLDDTDSGIKATMSI